MQHVRTFIAVTDCSVTGCYAARYIEANPLPEMCASTRSKVRGVLRKAGYSDAVGALLTRKYVATPHFGGLSGPACAIVSNALGSRPRDIVDTWDVDTAREVSNQLVQSYSNSSSAANVLAQLRAGLRDLGVPQLSIDATFHPEVTATHNLEIEVSRKRRMETGLDIPEPFRDVQTISARIVDQCHTGAPPTAQTAADLLVTFSARPGEAETLELGPADGLVGALKKRGKEDEFPIVSAIDIDQARAFLKYWREQSSLDRIKAMTDLSSLVKTWGVLRKDLRAIGAHLAVRVRAPANVGQAEDIRVAALRQAPPMKRAVDHYTHVNDESMDDYLTSLSSDDEAPLEPPVVAPSPTTFGPFQGKGSQAEAVNASGTHLVILVDRHEFYSFSTLEARATFLDDHRHRELIERVDCTKPYRVAIDFDGPPHLGLEAIEQISQAFAEAASDLGVPIPDPRVVWRKRGDKTSAHLIADGWFVGDGGKAIEFARRVKELAPQHLQEYVDVKASGATTTCGLRLPGCPKRGIPNSELEPIGSEGPGPLHYWCLQGKEVPPELVYGHAPVNVPQPQKVPEGVLERFLTRIATEFPHFTLDSPPAAGSLASFTRHQKAHCTSCDREHESGAAYIRENAGTLWLNCRRADVGAAALSAERFAPTAPDPPPTDQYEVIIDRDVTAVEQYNSPTFHLEVHGEDDIYIRAPWKTGKTVMAGDVIRTIKTCLIISCRKTLSTALAAEFNAVDYRTIKGDFTDSAISNAPVSIWQVESLKRIPSDITPFDLVVVDEPAALIAHIFQPGASRAARVGLSMARSFIKHAGRLFVSDNDLTTAHVEAFQTIRQGRGAKVLVNEYKSWGGMEANIWKGGSAPIEVRRRLFQFLDAQAAARKANRPSFAAVVPCHSRKVANNIAREASLKYGDRRVKLYTAETDDLEKALDFADPATTWADIDVVVYTGTVSVGVSASLPRIIEAFAFFTSNNAGVQQSAQMIFRCRCLQRVSISYCGRAVYGLPQTSEALFRWATLAKNRHVIPDGFRGDRCPTIDSPTQEDPEALSRLVNQTFEGRLWVCNQLERNRSATWFVPRIRTRLEAAGCVVVEIEVGGRLDLAANILKVPLQELRGAKFAGDYHEQLAESERDLAAARAFPDAKEEYLEAEGGEVVRPLTAGEHQGVRAFYATKTYCDRGGLEMGAVEDLSENDRRDWIHHHAQPQQLQRYKNLANVVCGDHRPQELTTATGGEASDLVRRAFEAVGLSPDTGGYQCIDVKVLRDPPPVVLAVVADINIHGLRVLGDTHTARRRKAMALGVNAKKLAGTLQVAFAYVGATLVPEYITTRRDPTGYRVQWAWEHMRKGDPAPSPRPTHPIPWIAPSRDREVLEPLGGEFIADLVGDLDI